MNSQDIVEYNFLRLYVTEDNLLNTITYCIFKELLYWHYGVFNAWHGKITNLKEKRHARTSQQRSEKLSVTTRAIEHAKVLIKRKPQSFQFVKHAEHKAEVTYRKIRRAGSPPLHFSLAAKIRTFILFFFFLWNVRVTIINEFSVWIVFMSL